MKTIIVIMKSTVIMVIECFLLFIFNFNEKKNPKKSDLFRKKGGLVGPICGCVASAPHGFHMGHSHTKYCQLVRFSGQCTACRHHVWKLSDVLCHFVASASFNLTVVFSKTESIGVIISGSSWQPLSCYAPDHKLIFIQIWTLQITPNSSIFSPFF